MRHVMGLGLLACFLLTNSAYAPTWNFLSRFLGSSDGDSPQTAEGAANLSGTVPYEEIAKKIQELYAALVELEKSAKDLGLDTSENSEWRRQLEDKLLAQLGLDKMLLVAVAGGTNTGKSSIFNHLAGAQVSGVVETGGGTKHPVLLVPRKFSSEVVLKKLFPDMVLKARKKAEDATVAKDETHLYWEEGGKSLAEELLLFDTPDVDSSRTENWERAAHVVRAADVTVAIITEEKHTDDKIINFFKKAKEAGKPIIVVINKVDLSHPSDWIAWLAKFKEQSGVEPNEVYVVPRDREAAANNDLKFYQVGKDGKGKVGEPCSLRDHLTQLHIDDILVQTRRGSVREALTDPNTGALKLLSEVSNRSGEFQKILEQLKRATVLNDEAQQDVWPVLPFEVLLDATYKWWNAKRPALIRGVHWTYDFVARPFRGALRETTGVQQPKTPRDHLELYTAQEAAAIRDATNLVIDQLEPVLQFRAGKAFEAVRSVSTEGARQKLVDSVVGAHGQLPPITQGFQKHMDLELDKWEEEHPGLVTTLKGVDMGVAVARPPVTLALAIGSIWLAGGAVPTSAAAVQAAKTLLLEGGTAVTVGGGAAGVAQDAVLKGTVGDGSWNTTVYTLFNRLRVAYIYTRLDWLVKHLNGELTDVMREIQKATEVTETTAFKQAQSCAEWLTENVK